MPHRDKQYREILLQPFRLCAKYRPAFGTSGKEDMALPAFKSLYGADPFYHWIGLDSDLMYAAHKAAGGMTSVYRQLGIGCERLFRSIVMDQLHLGKDQIAWSYTVKKGDGSPSILTLDGRIDAADLHEPSQRKSFEAWLGVARNRLAISAKAQLQGAVFEVRQGYKSADSKRQNADMRSAIRALTDGYLFVVCVTSSQINRTVLRRYQNAKMLVLVGDMSGDSTTDTFSFFRDVLGYPLDEFFERNSTAIRTEVEAILRQLLSPS